MAEYQCIGQALLQGVGYMHDCGVVHCDIKPGNVLVSGPGLGVAATMDYADPTACEQLAAQLRSLPNLRRIAVADLGCVLPADPSHRSGNEDPSSLVTLEYRCPELLAGDRDLGAGVDVWGVGCVLAEL